MLNPEKMAELTALSKAYSVIDGETGTLKAGYYRYRTHSTKRSKAKTTLSRTAFSESFTVDLADISRKVNKALGDESGHVWVEAVYEGETGVEDYVKIEGETAAPTIDMEAGALNAMAQCLIEGNRQWRGLASESHSALLLALQQIQSLSVSDAINRIENELILTSRTDSGMMEALDRFEPLLQTVASDVLPAAIAAWTAAKLRDAGLPSPPEDPHEAATWHLEQVEASAALMFSHVVANHEHVTNDQIERLKKIAAAAVAICGGEVVYPPSSREEAEGE